ncbi:MAG: hypothetical protein R2939_12215 [Kofleriaceae bacterium]
MREAPAPDAPAPAAPAVEDAGPAEAAPAEAAPAEAAPAEVAPAEAADDEVVDAADIASEDADEAAAAAPEAAASAEPHAEANDGETSPFEVLDEADVMSEELPPPATAPAQRAITAVPRVPTAELAEPAPLLRRARVSSQPPPVFERLRELADAEMPADADPVTSEFFDAIEVGPLPPLGEDPWLVSFLDRRAGSAVALLGSEVRVAVRASAARAERLKRGPIDVHAALHRLPTAPVITLTFGTPASIRSADVGACAIATVDVTAEADRAAMVALGREFAITVDVFFDDGDRRRGRILGRLAENAGFLLRAADDHRRTIAARGEEASFALAQATVLSPSHDLFGAGHPDRDEFHEQSFGRLDTASTVLRALGVAGRFTQPDHEDYLVCIRGYPLSRWRDVRRGLLARAVEWGLWMGPDLAQVAVSEGFARSRRDLLARLTSGFELLRSMPQFFDLDDAVATANARVLATETEAVGGAVSAIRPIVDAAEADLAARSAPGLVVPPMEPGPGERRPLEELLAALKERPTRLDAAIELCERGEPSTIEPVMAAVAKMSRSEAVRVLGMMVRYGTAAAPALTTGLGSSKAFIRHGSALALAMLRTEAGAEAVIELLLREPTEIWREIARAVGQIGPPALMALATQLGRLGEGASEGARERVAWAMAHVAVRGGRSAVEALAAGTSIVAPVASQAVGLIAPASRDEVRVRASNSGTQPGREVTVNRAFSRRFFEALEKGLPALGKAELSAMEAAEPMELLDEADLIEDDDAPEALDERDLLPG